MEFKNLDSNSQSFDKTSYNMSEKLKNINLNNFGQGYLHISCLKGILCRAMKQIEKNYKMCRFIGKTRLCFLITRFDCVYMHNEMCSMRHVAKI